MSAYTIWTIAFLEQNGLYYDAINIIYEEKKDEEKSTNDNSATMRCCGNDGLRWEWGHGRSQGTNGDGRKRGSRYRGFYSR